LFDTPTITLVVLCVVLIVPIVSIVLIIHFTIVTLCFISICTVSHWLRDWRLQFPKFWPCPPRLPLFNFCSSTFHSPKSQLVVIHFLTGIVPL
ncbi:hypothetical protein BS17DRAFT_841062, partial [Gyrodon lividus]